MAVVVLSFLTAILLVAGSYQAAYSKSPKTKTRWFRTGLVAVASVAAVLMIWTAWEGQKSQTRLEETLAGVSQIVFPKDMVLEFQGAYEFDPAARGFGGDGQLLVSVIPRTSNLFCKWGVTHTPVEDSALGRIFSRMMPVPAGDSPVGFGDGSVQIFSFQLRTLVTNGQLRVVGSPGALIPMVMAKNVAIDDYLQSQFIVEFLAPGRITAVEHAVLKLKGRPVPFYLFESEGRFIGSTVFYPTWKRYCERRSN